MPLLYRDVQSAFQDSLQAFSASVKASPKGAACPFDAQGVPEFPVGYWFLSPEQVRFSSWRGRGGQSPCRGRCCSAGA